MISVIVPVHNGEKTLRRCVDSILRSTEKKIEIILVENGSSDKTLDICKSYSDKYNNIRTIESDVTGISHARNIGMRAAKGKWIAFVDADDYIHPSMYAWLLEAAESKHFDFVFGDILMGAETDYAWNSQISHSSESVSVDTFCKVLFCVAQYEYSVVTNKLFSAELLKEVLFDETLHYAEDREFVFRVLTKVSSIGHICTPVYYYYQENAESISKSSSMETRMDQVRSLEKCIATADTSFSTFPKYGEYVAACLLQNADFRKKRAEECGLIEQVKELEPIIEYAVKRVRSSKHLEPKTKYRCLLEHSSPRLFNLLVKIMGKS